MQLIDYFSLIFKRRVSVDEALLKTVIAHLSRNGQRSLSESLLKSMAPMQFIPLACRQNGHIFVNRTGEKWIQYCRKCGTPNPNHSANQSPQVG